VNADADTVRLVVPSHPKHLPLVRAFVEQAAEIAGFGTDDRERIVLAVTEGITNVIRHSYHGDTDRRIDLTLCAPPGTFHLEIQDYGRFVDPTQIASRPLDDVRPGGLGVHLMKATMDRVEYRRNEAGGTTLTLVKFAEAPKRGRT
jgi:anti-sigma regulatory factor (Ser/Thr protein kinase)